MDIFTSVLLIVVGIAMLLGGAEALVRSAVSLAVRMKVAPATIGLTVLAAGTSAPELFTSLKAAHLGSIDISVGNVIGSNIFNILGVLGVSCLIQAHQASKNTLKLDWPVLAGASALFFIFSKDFVLSQWESSVLAGSLVAFISYVVYLSRKNPHDFQPDDDIETLKHPLLDIIFLICGFALLSFGADTALDGAIKLGKIAGMSDRLIGITIVSVGTGLPELSTSAVAAFKGRTDIAISNVIGSNIFNTLGVLGVTGAVFPLSIGTDLVQWDMICMLGATLSILAFSLNSRRTIGRIPGGMLLITYVLYLYSLI